MNWLSRVPQRDGGNECSPGVSRQEAYLVPLIKMKCDSKIEQMFDSLARYALAYDCNPMEVFDRVSRFVCGDICDIRRELVGVWKRRKHEYPWFFHDEV